MACNIRVYFMVLVLLSSVGVSFGQVNNTSGQLGLSTQTEDVSAASARGKAIPSINDLMTVIDKATTTETEGKDWSTPVKLVIIFSGLAILPSLLVMMTSFTRIVIVLSFVRRVCW